MNLALDIGNTRTKLGLFSGNKLVEKMTWTSWSAHDLLLYCQNMHVDAVICSSVAAPDLHLANTLQVQVRWLELTHTTLLPFANLYRTPETLGKDRLAAIAGADALFTSTNCLVIDSGTCIKYDFINAQRQYVGGNIAPGLMMRTKAMHHFTARLPEVPLDLPADFVGVNTTTALQNGAFLGALLEVKGFIGHFQQMTKDLNVILTGGDAKWLSDHLTIYNHIVEPDLVLYGLNHILKTEYP